MSSLSWCCIDFHDDILYGLGVMDRGSYLEFKSHSLRRLMRWR
jgi:hypothetical protein